MKCERCGAREAEVHIRQQKGKEIAEFHLCRQCAEHMAKEGLIPDISFELPINSFLWGLLPGHEPGHPGSDVVPSAASDLVCGHCGLDRSSLRRSGRYGCPDCFKAFHEDLGPLLRKIHGSEIHRGARPGNACGNDTSPEEIESLRTELKDAVEKEEYERAAVLRDRIREIGDLHEGRS